MIALCCTLLTRAMQRLLALLDVEERRIVQMQASRDFCATADLKNFAYAWNFGTLLSTLVA